MESSIPSVARRDRGNRSTRRAALLESGKKMPRMSPVVFGLSEYAAGLANRSGAIRLCDGKPATRRAGKRAMGRPIVSSPVAGCIALGRSGASPWLRASSYVFIITMSSLIVYNSYKD